MSKQQLIKKLLDVMRKTKTTPEALFRSELKMSYEEIQNGIQELYLPILKHRINQLPKKDIVELLVDTLSYRNLGKVASSHDPLLGKIVTRDDWNKASDKFYSMIDWNKIMESLSTDQLIEWIADSENW